MSNTENELVAAALRTEPKAADVGKYIDAVAGKKRTPKAVAGRLLEEAVELLLEAGGTPLEVMGHVMDSLHNQALKVSRTANRTVFPSQMEAVKDPEGLAGECADIRLLVRDLEHVAGIDGPRAEQAKYEAFIKKDLRVGPHGTVYAIKPHVTAAASSSDMELTEKTKKARP